MNIQNITSNLDKLYSISEASSKTDIETHTLRYWEKNGLINPVRTSSGRRRYSNDHISELFRLKKMIKEEELTIKAAKKRLKTFKANRISNDGDSLDNKKMKFFLRNLKTDIKQILRMLK